jgi:DNA (cytosine-5)-methyltransferase 1
LPTQMSTPDEKKVRGTVAELFAGVGGFRLGLEKSGLKTVFSNQWEPSTKIQHASDVYVSRFGSAGHTNFDIKDLEDIPQVDVLVGGFPCQDYSVAKSLNSSKGLEGKKGVLWWEILRLIQKRKPRFVFLENVDRLLKSPSSQKGRDFAVMLKTLGDEGYQIEWRVVNAADYGFPQRRIRVFIVAYLKPEIAPDPKRELLEFGVLSKALPVKMNAGNPVPIELHMSPESISSMFNLNSPKSPFLNAGLYSENKAFTMQVEPDYSGARQALGDVLEPEELVPSEFWVRDEKLREWEFLKGAKNLDRTHKSSGIQYRYSEGKMAFPDSLERPSRTILTGEGGSSPSRFKHIIQSASGFRRLMPVELERLNGFPDDWTKYTQAGNVIPDAKRAFFMGNALVIGLVTMVGNEISSRLDQQLS